MAKKLPDFDLKEFKHVKDHVTELKMDYAKRDNYFKEVDEIYLMDSTKIKSAFKADKNAKITLHPRPRNKILGAIRLLTLVEPEFNIVNDFTGRDKDKADKLEEFARKIYKAVGKVRGDPLTYDIVRSALLYGEIHGVYRLTKDMVKAATGTSKAHMQKLEDIANITPIMFDILKVKHGYPEMSELGLDAYASLNNVTYKYLIDTYGDVAKRIIERNNPNYSPYDLTDYWEFFDDIYHYVWIVGFDLPIIQAKHELPRIPVEVQLVEGSRLFDKPEEQRTSFLYTYIKSKLWFRQNLMLTSTFNNIYALGLIPTFYHKMGPSNKGDIIKDFNTLGGEVRIPYGHDFGPMADKNLIDPAVKEMMQYVNKIEDESTIYPQALGESLGATATYSATSLLTQTGRLPLSTVERKSGWFISNMMKNGIKLMGDKGISFSSKLYGDQYKLAKKDIPKDFELNVKLTVEFPQDALQQAATVERLIASGIITREWAQEKILHIGQTRKMQNSIWSEQAADIFFDNYVQDLMRKEQMKQKAFEDMQNPQEGESSQGMEQPSPMPQPGMPQPSNAQKGLNPATGDIPNQMTMGGGAPLDNNKKGF